MRSPVILRVLKRGALRALDSANLLNHTGESKKFTNFAKDFKGLRLPARRRYLIALCNCALHFTLCIGYINMECSFKAFIRIDF